jgi:hypothetical protein
MNQPIFLKGDHVTYNASCGYKITGDYVVTKVTPTSITAFAAESVQPTVVFNPDGSTTYPDDGTREDHTPDYGAFFTHTDDVTKCNFKVGDRVGYGNYIRDGRVIDIDHNNRTITVKGLWRGTNKHEQRTANLDGTSLYINRIPGIITTNSIDLGQRIVKIAEAPRVSDSDLALDAREATAAYEKARKELVRRGYNVVQRYDPSNAAVAVDISMTETITTTKTHTL